MIPSRRKLTAILALICVALALPGCQLKSKIAKWCDVFSKGKDYVERPNGILSWLDAAAATGVAPAQWIAAYHIARAGYAASTAAVDGLCARVRSGEVEPGDAAAQVAEAMRAIEELIRLAAQLRQTTSPPSATRDLMVAVDEGQLLAELAKVRAEALELAAK